MVERGDPDSPPVLLVHGWGCSAYVFRQNIPALADGGFRAIAFDLKGHGLSDKPQTADEYTSLGLVPQRIVASVSASLGLVGVLLAALGIYGVTAYAVTRRTREIGIRIALGAQRVDVMQMILREGMRLAAIGAAIGLTLAASAGRLLSSFLLGVAPIDAVAFAGAAALFAAVGLAACYMPARRATRIDAMEALRYE